LESSNTISELLLERLCLRNHSLLIASPCSLSPSLKVLDRSSDRIGQFARIGHHRIDLAMRILGIRIVGKIVQGTGMQGIKTCHVCIQGINSSGYFGAL
jgi:hypothetical protein